MSITYMAWDSGEQYLAYSGILSPIQKLNLVSGIYYEGCFCEQGSTTIVVISASFSPKCVAQTFHVSTCV